MANYLLLIVKEGEALENQRDAKIPRLEHVGGEEDSIQVQLDASTPIMVFKNEACGLRVDNTISIN